MKIDRHGFEMGGAPYFVAELGIAHQGNMKAAANACGAALLSGANAVKFQHHIPGQEMVPEHPWWDVVSRASLKIQQLVELSRHAAGMGLGFICTPFSVQAVREMVQYQHAFDALKIGSAELQSDKILAAVAELWTPLGKPVIVSEGFQELTLEQYEFLGGADRVVLLGCSSRYPAAPESCYPGNTPRRRYELLPRVLDMNVPFYWGYSLHSHWAVGVAAAAAGADLIEAHFWPVRNGLSCAAGTTPPLPIPDNPVNLDPYRFNLLVEGAKVAARMPFDLDGIADSGPSLSVESFCYRNSDGLRDPGLLKETPCRVLPFVLPPAPTTEN